MPRPKRAKTKGPKGPEAQPSNGAPENGPPQIAVAEAAPAEELQPPTTPVETTELPQPEDRTASGGQRRRDRPPPQKPASVPHNDRPSGGGPEKGPDDKDHIAATSLNIAKLQAMS